MSILCQIQRSEVFNHRINNNIHYYSLKFFAYEFCTEPFFEIDLCCLILLFILFVLPFLFLHLLPPPPLYLLPIEQVRGYLRLNSILDPDTDTEESVEIFNKTMNLCQIMASKKIDPLIRVIFSEMLKNGTMFSSCPIQKRHYYLQNFRIDEENLPSYLPETDFLAEIHVFSEPKSGKLINFFVLILNGLIDKSKALNDFKIFTMG